MDFSLNLFIIIVDQLMLFVINMLVARHAGEALFGDFTVATNALFLLGTLITFGIDSIIAYYVPKLYVTEKYQEINELTFSIKSFLQPIYLTILVAGILLTLALLGLSDISHKLAAFDITHPFFLFLWGTVALSLYNIYLQLFRAINYMRTAVLLSLCQTLCYFVLSLIIYFYIYPVYFHDNRNYFPHVMLIGFILSYLLMVFTSVVIQQRSNLRLYQSLIITKSKKWKNKIYGYTVQNLNKYVFTVIPLLVMEWIGHSEHEVGLFSAVTSIISLALIAIAPIGVLIGPEISAAFAQERKILKQVMFKYLWICFSISVVILVVMAFLAKQILILYKSNFISALPYAYLCLINIVTFAISMPLSKMIQYSHEGSEVGAKLTINLLLFQFITCLILIHWLQLLGAIICYLGINILYNIIMVVMALKIYRIDPFEKEINEFLQ